MPDNPVVEVIARALQPWAFGGNPRFYPSALKEGRELALKEAHAIIAALEGEGWKVVGRKPTPDMSLVAREHFNISGEEDYMLEHVWEVAPSWAGNKKAPPPE